MKNRRAEFLIILFSIACGMAAGNLVERARQSQALAEIEALKIAMTRCDTRAVILDKELEEDRETFWRAWANCKR